MDAVKAKDLEDLLLGRTVGDCTVGKLVNHGKSAAVFRAKQGERDVALKIFDDELIERYGDATQLARIERELTLVGKYHPNMVEILGGGFDDVTRNHYIVMEYLEGPNIKQSLASIPIENTGNLIAQLAACAEYLETLGLVHRDIKPENIVVLDNFEQLKLLDFGVLRPVGQPGLTDDQGIQSFVGTLQYSSPEFLMREERDTVEGWRALTFYQIGGVLHDLIMKRALFEEQATPYGRLVGAVQHEVPQIVNPAVPSYLTDVARVALSKDPQARANLLSWNSFRPPASLQEETRAAKERVVGRHAVLTATQPSAQIGQALEAELLEAVVQCIKMKARSIRGRNPEALPPVIVAREKQCVTVKFRPSEPHALQSTLTLCLDVTIVDAAIEAIQIGAVAYYGDGSVDRTALGTPVYRGVFSQDNVGAKLEDCIFICVDEAQRQGLVASSEVLSLSNVAEGVD